MTLLTLRDGSERLVLFVQLTLDCHSAAPPAIIDTHSRHVTVRLEKVAVSGYQFELVLTSYMTGEITVMLLSTC